MKKVLVLLSLLLVFSFGFAQLSGCGDSYIVFNSNWFNGSATFQANYFDGYNLGTLSSNPTLGGEVQSWDNSGDYAKLGYKFDGDDGTIAYVDLTLISTTAGQFNNNDQWQANPGNSIDISGLSTGAHTLEVWFWVHDNDASVDVYDSNGGVNYVADFTIPEGEVPITLASFTAEALKGKVKLDWVTESETENSHFLVYRDGEVIGQVDGAGTTTEQHVYSFVDDMVIPGLHNYAIADVTYGGVEELHDAVVVEVGEALADADFVLDKAFPNPFNPSITINYQLSTINSVSAFIYNAHGNMIKELLNDEMNAGSHTLTWNAAGMPSGVYIVKMIVGDVVRSQKIVLMK